MVVPVADKVLATFALLVSFGHTLKLAYGRLNVQRFYSFFFISILQYKLYTEAAWVSSDKEEQEI
jgi:hypothetical protein